MKQTVGKRILALLMVAILLMSMPICVLAEDAATDTPVTEETVGGNQEEGDDTDRYADAMDVADAEGLAEALELKSTAIRITGDFVLDRTFYVTANTVLFAEEAHTLTRSPSFGGDLFVVGEEANGVAVDGSVSLQIGHHESTVTDLLVIDGNSANMTVDVTGTVLFVCANAKVSLYDNLTVQNCKKVGNEKTHNAAYELSYTERIGGPVAIVAGGTANIYGGNYRNNSVNDEGAEGSLVSTQGGAFYFFGPANVYGGTFENNHAYRGGAWYAYRTLTVYGGSVKNNTASDHGGAIYMPASTLCHLYMMGDNDYTSQPISFYNNSAGGYGGALYAQGVLVEIDTATFEQNAAGVHGGAISLRIDSDGADDIKMNVRNTTFKGNRADYNGGAVYMQSTAAYFEEVVFEGNTALATANESGSRYGGGGVYSTGSYVEMNGATFTNNTSDYYGAGIELHSSSTAVLNAITTSGNSAAYSGFFHVNNSTVNVYNSAIRGNAATGSGGAAGLYNNAVLNAYLTSFENNTAGGSGGALYVYTDGSASLLHSCAFVGNTASDYGGSMYVSKASVLVAYNTTAKQNQAAKGGFLYETTTNTTVTLNGLTVSDNTATDGGAIIWGNTVNAVLYLNKITYVDMDVSGSLEDAYWTVAIANKLTVNETTEEVPGFVNYGETEETPPEAIVNPNVTNVIELQAALTAGLSKITIISDFVIDRTLYVASDATLYASGERTLTRKADFGEDLFVVGESASGDLREETVTLRVLPEGEGTSLTIDGNRDNMTVDVIGSVFFVCPKAQLDLYDGVTVKNANKVGNKRSLNEAYGMSYTDRIGGAVVIVTANASLNVYGGVYQNNRVNDEGADGSLLSTQGGVVYSFGTANIYGGTFEQNHAQRGGVFYNYRTMHLYAAEIVNNTASDTAGVVYMPASTSCYLYVGGDNHAVQSQVVMQGNSAVKHGGAIYAQGALLQVEDAVFSGNTSGGHGGAIYATMGSADNTESSLVLKNSTFTENTADYNGGAVYMTKTKAHYRYVDFIGNHAKATANDSGTRYGGGALYATGSVFDVVGATFRENVSEYTGGAVALYSSSKAVLYNVTATANQAVYGGFLYSKAQADVYNSRLIQNKAESYGGAIHLANPAVTNLYCVTFRENEAESQGGALYIYTDGTETTAHSCTFIGNRATSYGGGIYASKVSQVALYNTIAEKNHGLRGGFLYETTTGTTVTVNGLHVSGNTADDGGPIIWGNSTGAVLYFNKTNFTADDGTTADQAVVNKLKVTAITDDIPEYDEYGDEAYDQLTGYVEVGSADELEAAINAQTRNIRIMADIVLDRTLYIASEITLFSTTPYRLTRAADFGGDLFVVGETADGRNVVLDNGKAKLTLGNPQSTTQELLVIDGNRKGTTVEVVGSLIFVANSAQVDMYHNVSLVNGYKLGNERTADPTYVLSWPYRVGGAAVTVAGGVMNMYGGIVRNNAINEEILSEELGEAGRNSTLGGAVYNQGTLNIYDGTFSFNKGARGGAIYSRAALRVTGGTFVNNHASVSGGAVYMANTEYAAGYMGGTTGNVTSIFQNNTAYKHGAAIYTSASATLVLMGDMAFIGNRAQKGNGGAVYANGTLLADNIVFQNNTSYKDGGAIAAINASETMVPRELSVKGCTFQNNRARNGGAVLATAYAQTYPHGTTMAITDCLFEGNVAASQTGTTGHGGAIYASYKSLVTVDNTDFLDNTAVSEGGALYVAYEADVALSDVQFSRNHAGGLDKGYGGAIAVHSATLDIVNSQLSENTAAQRGGALYISYNTAVIANAVVAIADSTFANNYTEALGGAVYGLARGTRTIIDATTGEETTIQPLEDWNLLLDNVDFTGNIADGKGGALYLSSYTRTHMLNTDFVQNTVPIEASGCNGGAIYANSSAYFEINGGSFTENKAGANGGALGLYSNSEAVLNNVIATGNQAVGTGGFAQCDTATVTMYNSTLSDNVAGGSGGGFVIIDLSVVNLYNNTFIGNTAGAYGGALYVYTGGSSVLVHKTAFTQNTAATYGGAIYVSNKSLLDLYDVTASGNHAAKGGFMYETTSATTVTLNGLSVSENTADDGGPIIWGNTTAATLNFNKANFTAADGTSATDAVANKLTVKEITTAIPGYVDYTDSLVSEKGTVSPTYPSVTVDHVFALADSSSTGVINAYYTALPKLDNTSNFMSDNTTVFSNINGADVTVDTFIYQQGDTAGNGNVGEGLLIWQALQYKRQHPEEAVKISISSFRFSVAAALCVNRDSRYFGYMRNLYGANYDKHGFVRISYLLLTAARMGIDVTVIGQLDAYPVSASDATFEEYFSAQLGAPCDPNYVANGTIGDYMTFRPCAWKSYDNKGSTDMMHTKVCAVSHYLDQNGVAHQNALWTSSSNLDGINTNATNGNNNQQVSTIVSDHPQLYRVATNYLQLITQYCDQEEVYAFREIASARAQEQIDLLNAGQGDQIPSDQQIVYLGTEEDTVFELYFAPFGGEIWVWDEVYNPYCKYLREWSESEDYVWLTWNNVKFVDFSLRSQIEDVIVDTYHKNRNSNNRIYINLPNFNADAFRDLVVGEDIGFMSFNKKDFGVIHNKDLQLSYEQDGERVYVSLLNSMNIHAGSMSYQSNFLLAIKETDCEPDSVFFTVADRTAVGIIDHTYSEEKVHYPDTSGEGYTYQECTHCGKILITGVAHRTGEWIVDREATEERHGIAHKECAVCGLLIETREFTVGSGEVTLNATEATGQTFVATVEEGQRVSLTACPQTFEAVVQVPNSQTERVGVILGNYDAKRAVQLNVEIYSYGRVRLFATNKGQVLDHVFNTDIRSENPVHLAITVEDTTAKLYLDGVLRETAVLSMPLPALADEFVIGGDQRLYNQQYFKETICAVYAFADVRTAEEVYLDHLGVFADEEGLLLRKTFSDKGGRTFTTEDSSLIEVPLSAAPQTFEVTVQVSKTLKERGGVLFGNYDGSGKDQLNMDIFTYGRPRLYYVTGGVAYSHTFSTDIRSHNAVHLAVTVDGTTATLYVNGALKETATLPAALPAVTEGFTVGGDSRPGNTQYFRGEILGISVFADLRTAAEIRNDLQGVAEGTAGLLYTADLQTASYKALSSGKTFTSDTASQVAVPLTEAPRTMEAMVQLAPDVTGRGGVLFGNYDGSKKDQFNVDIFTDGHPRLYYVVNGTAYSHTFSTDIRSNKMVHVAITVEGTTAKLYVNSVLMEVDTLPAVLPDVCDNFVVGGDHRPGNEQYFRGKIQSFTVFSIARSLGQIRLDKNGVYPLANGLLYSADFQKAWPNATSSGMTFTAHSSPVAGSLTAAPHTVEAIVQLSPEMTGRGGVLFGNYDGLGKDQLNVDIFTQGRPRLYYTVNGTEYSHVFTTDIRSNSPIHLAVTMEGVTACLYVNGVLKETATLPATLPEVTEDFMIGGDNCSQNEMYFRGTLYAINVFSDVRTAQEIAEDMVLVSADAEGVLLSRYVTTAQPLSDLNGTGGKTFATNTKYELGGLKATPHTLEAVVQIDPSMDGRMGTLVGNYDVVRTERLNWEIYTNGRVRLFASSNGTVTDHIFATDVRSDNPIHLAVTVEGTTACLYVNGVLKETATLPAALPEVTEGFMIGGDRRAQNLNYFKGKVYAVHLFADVRTPEEVSADVTAVAADTQLLHAVYFSAAPKSGDMTLSQVLGATFKQNTAPAVEDKLPAAIKTIEAVVKIPKTQTLRAGVIVGNYDTSDKDKLTFDIFTNGRPRLYYEVNTTVYSHIFTTDVRSDTPSHLAVTVEGTTACLYVNGVLKETAILPAALPNITEGFVIGGDNREKNEQYFKGTLYAVNLYADVRTAEEVAADVLTTDTGDRALMRSLVMTGDGCMVTGAHAESDWIIDRVATDDQVGRRHTVCTICGATLTCAKDGVAEETVEHRVYVDATGLTPLADSKGVALDAALKASPLTFEATVQLSKSVSQRGGVIIGNYKGGTGDQLNFDIFTYGKPRLYYVIGGKGYSCTFTTDVRSDSLTHLAVTVDGTTATLYVNGVKKETVTLTAALPKVTDGFYVGADGRPSMPQYFRGTIYNVSLFADVRTEEEIARDRYMVASDSENLLYTQNFLKAQQ